MNKRSQEFGFTETFLKVYENDFFRFHKKVTKKLQHSFWGNSKVTP
ncbi:hypothetical protein LIKHA_63 [Paenibacillus phage Likha]|uniref:Uncharacterized protein n=3 Tax=Fernvirus TaxID=2843380 RepID=A0A0K2CYJ7_9CAUD|nr:hypothetical protein XENIA_74 [Paenibacillus phage Xenia]YP_009836617.1 hypothetical protein HWB47_gp73 [Paenibacillus phage Leyra]YP_009836682.1 hypothetical protein HWB48_gp63 [Paenibacillus phage Likha]UYL93486.1 hypothetical protein VB_PLAS1A_71 [Paenibacillus phage vB_PlaS-1/A]UYL93557.1 hypothetical protein VB_PLAS2A_70 [Paenibacillus phage vB_PlaS-2/A]UYL93628.1 hypothetical protein VB_PLAS3A_69 [Paenibacillus phage vB_PlaS-3/A]UYL93700.1 hypothetical protein VB_PLAS5A_71 [Paenibaci